MCGLVYAHDFAGQPVNNDIMQQFDKQRSRGTEGFGLFDGQEMHLVRAAKEDKILKWLVKYDSNLIMFHHRNPTSTINVKRAAHPFATKDYFGDNQYIMIHNGVIYNDDELFEQHQEKGIEYQSMLEDLSYNDSEALLWDLALTLEGKQPEMTARGAIAFVCMKLHKGKLDKLYFGRNINPLKLDRNKAHIALSSEGEGEMIDPQTLYTFNYALKRLTKREFNIPNTSYGGYSDNHYRGYAGDWLPGNIRGKVRKYLGYDERYDYDKDGNPIEYEQDRDTQMYLPVGTRQPSFDDMEDEEALEPYKPLRSEVETRALRFILAAQGVLEVAYWKAEDEYSTALEADDGTVASIREILLMEDVLAYIEDDPEYVNDKSVSSIWGALWQQASK